MKRATNRILVLLLAVFMVVSMIPMTATADTKATYNLWIGGTQVTDDNLSGPGWAFDPGSNTLTLTNVNIGGEGGIPVDSSSGVGIYAEGMDLTIKGTGEVKAKWGIYSKDGTLTLVGKDAAVELSTDLTVTGTEADAIYASGDINITNSKLLLTSSGGSGVYAYEGAITIKGSEISTTDFSYCGIYALLSIAISDKSKINLDMIEDGYGEYGIYADAGEVSIENSKVDIGACDDWGIYAYQDYDEDDVAISINNSQVTTGGDEAGIYAYYDDIVLSENNTIEVTDSEYPIWVYYGNVDIKNSKVTAVGESSAYGICAYYGTLTISGAKSLVEAEGYDYAVDGEEGLILTDVSIIKPEGGAVSPGGNTIYDAGGNVATYVLIQGNGYADIIRLAGKDRYVTAMEAANHLKEQQGIDKFNSVVLASGKNFPDALSASYLAYVKDGPILLVDTAVVGTITDYVNANLAEGGKVYIVGGKGAVPLEVDEKIAAVSGEESVVRLAGKDRFATNLLVLGEAGVEGKDMLVASGMGFADALSASAAKRPILLVGAMLTTAQKDYLTENNASLTGQFYVIGGTGAVSQDVYDAVSEYGTVERLKGSDRFTTSVAVANKFFPDSVETVVVANGVNFPDGLSGGPIAAYYDAPLILVTDGVKSHAVDFFAEKAAKKLVVVGGKGVVSDETAEIIAGLS